MKHNIPKNSVDPVKNNQDPNKIIKREAEKILNEAIIIGRWDRNPFYIS